MCTSVHKILAVQMGFLRDLKRRKRHGEGSSSGGGEVSGWGGESDSSGVGSGKTVGEEELCVSHVGGGRMFH